MAKITISGYMGSGKSLVGKILSEKLSLPFYDLDNIIEKIFQKRIFEIFKENGEENFRKLEKKILLDLLNKDEDYVLSLGGGTILDEESLKAVIFNSIPIFLKGDIKIFYSRIKNSEDRPLLTSQENFIKLYKKRESFYNKIPIKIDSDDDINLTINKILSLLKTENFEKPQKIHYEIGVSFKYKNFLFNYLIFDSKAFKFYEDRFNYRNYYLIKKSERSKNLNEYCQILYSLSSFGFEKSDILCGVGGGVVCDLTGFVASTYMRGVNFYLFPTTLLSQVDSSIGGKNGVNLKEGKNLVGTIYLPKETIIDPTFLFSLKKKELLSGLGEIFKYSIISEKLFNELESLNKIDFYEIISLISRSIKEKLKFIEKDLLDNKNKRIFLNLGHTTSHLIETLFKYKNISHGEGVSFGVLFSSFLSNRLEILSNESFEKTYNLYKKIGFDYHKFFIIKDFENDFLIKILLLDKKSSNKKLNLIIPKNIGNLIILKDFDPNQFIKYLFDFIKFLEAL